MSKQETLEVSEAEIAVHWQEEEKFYPSAQFIAQANLTDPAIYERFGLENFPECFKEYADLLTWYQYWHTTLDTSDAPCWKWFVGGKINASYNCVDRHLPKYKNKAAIIYVPEPEDEPHVALTYQELYVRVNELAALLRDFGGLTAGDRVTSVNPWLTSRNTPSPSRLMLIESGEVWNAVENLSSDRRSASSTRERRTAIAYSAASRSINFRSWSV